MVLITKKNISKALLAESVNQVVMLETKFGIKQVVVEEVTVSRGLTLRQGRGKPGYLFRRVQGKYLMRTGTSTILHGLAKDVVQFIKNDDYYLEGDYE